MNLSENHSSSEMCKVTRQYSCPDGTPRAHSRNILKFYFLNRLEKNDVIVLDLDFQFGLIALSQENEV